MIELAKKFLIFNKISKKLARINCEDEEQIKNMEKLIDFYIINYSEKGTCLLNKLNIFRN